MNAHQEAAERSDAAATPYARAVIAKPGPDEHHHSTRGIAQALRAEGFIVTCIDLDQASEQILAVVIAEDAPTPPPAVRWGTPRTRVDTVINRLKQEAAGAALVVVGGIVPAASISALMNTGANSMLEWAC